MRGRAGIRDLQAVLSLEERPDAFATLANGPINDIKVLLGA